MKALKCEVKGKPLSPSKGPDVLKVPSWATPAGPIWKLHTKPNEVSFFFAFSYLEVPSIVTVERVEEVIWLWDERNQLELLLQISGRKNNILLFQR